jgi:hypothetical protein
MDTGMMRARSNRDRLGISWVRRSARVRGWRGPYG